MSKQKLLSAFIKMLNEVSSNKKELVYEIADILNIEPESVYRRLAGTVKFSVDEMGVLANSMNISLDALLNRDSARTSVFLELGIHSNSITIDHLIYQIEEMVRYWQRVKSQVINVGFIFTSLPFEFFIFHPQLCKYMYFKWGHYYVGTKEFDNFSAWDIPTALTNAQNRYRESFKIPKKMLYLWDRSLIPSLVNEINYHLFLGILTPEDGQLIKKELHDLLENFQEFVKGKDTELVAPAEIELECYVTNLNVGVTSYYIICENSYLSVINSLFFNSAYHYDSTTALKIYDWIHSIKKISSLISGGCEKESVVFFRKQHQIVDNIGTLSL